MKSNGVESTKALFFRLFRYCCRSSPPREKKSTSERKKRNLDSSLSPFSYGIEGSITASLHPDSNRDAPEGSLARRGGSARLCGRIVVVDVKADAAAAAAAVVVAAGLCRLVAALPPSSRAVRTAPPPPQLTEEDNMRSHSRAPRGGRKLRGNGKRRREGWERIFSLRSLLSVAKRVSEREREPR